MNSLYQGWLVARRELRERGRSRAFVASLIVMAAAVVAAIVLPTLIDTSGGTHDIGLTGATETLLPSIIEAQGDVVGTETRVHRYENLTDAEQAVRNGEIDVLIVDSKRLEWPERADEELKALATSAIQLSALQDRARAAGITESDLSGLLAPVPVTNVELGGATGRSADDETVAFVMNVLLFMTIATYGAMVLSGVVEEKSNRVVEVLLARIPARNLLAGKIAGIGLLGLAQVAVTAVAALVAVSTVSRIELPAVRVGVLAWAIVWFVVGYALYATVFGALGSLASRPEDAQSAAGPVSVLLVLVYFVSFASIGSPDTAWARVVSWIPMTAPMAMPTRIAMGAATWWEPLLAVALTAAAVSCLVVLGGRVYAAAILHNGPTLTLRDAWSGARTTRSSARHADTDPPRQGRRVDTVVIATAAALVLAAVAFVFSRDVVIGVGVGAASYAVIDRTTKAWGGRGGTSADSSG